MKRLNLLLIGWLFSMNSFALAETFGPQEIAPGVFALAASNKYADANMGWVDLGDRVVLIGAPHPDRVKRALEMIQKSLDKPVRSAVLTHLRQGEIDSASLLAEQGVTILAPEKAVEKLRAAMPKPDLLQHMDPNGNTSDQENAPNLFCSSIRYPLPAHWSPDSGPMLLLRRDKKRAGTHSSESISPGS